jgi:hypothetical protein
MITKSASKHPIISRPIERLIHVIRGQKVMIDSDLAALYGVQTKRLNEAVRRNAHRFPASFMFELTPQEAATTRSQFATASKRSITIQLLASVIEVLVEDIDRLAHEVKKIKTLPKTGKKPIGFQLAKGK